MPSHYFQPHGSFVAGSSRMQTVQRVGHTTDRGVKADRHGGCFQIIVDRFRHADDWKSLLVKLERGGERAVAAHYDEPVDTEFRQGRPGAFDDLFRDHRFLAAAYFRYEMALVGG